MPKIQILGTTYSIDRRKFGEDEYFASASVDGYCDGVLKQIVVCDTKTLPGWENEPSNRCELTYKATLRHEIVHAFLNESGLSDSSFSPGSGWAKNEEMVDWIATQGPKIHTAWEKAGALE